MLESTVGAGSVAFGTNGDRTTLLDRARSIAKLIEADADAVEQDARITRRIHQAFVEQGLIWLPLPVEYGGADADVATCIEVVEEISRADGSAGWTLFVNLATFSGLFPFLSEETLALLYADGHPPVMAGQLNPAGRSETAADGHLCSGRHSFASGSAYADWICAAQILHEGDQPIMKADGTPKITIGLFPKNDVEFKGNWDVMGLAGTASYDYEVTPQIVPPIRMLDGDILSPFAEPLRGNAMLRMGALVAAYCLHTACALGIARRALQEMAALAGRKSRIGYGCKTSEDPVFLNAFAQADAEYWAARGRLIAVFKGAEAKVAGGGKLTLDDHAIMRQTATWTHVKAGEVVATCFRWAGTTPVRNPNVLGRCMRDILVANSHMLFDPKTMTDVGPILVERWSASLDALPSA
jgi:alkylation response protein AidB-like acyl-CoA dehydrogenase